MTPFLTRRSQLPRWLGDRVTARWGLLVGVVKGFGGEKLALRAGNLTFITITSLVPLLAVALALLHAFNARRIDPLLRRLVEDVLSPGLQAQSAPIIHKIVDAASSRAGGGLSFLVVLLSAGALLRHLDASLNDIWSVRSKRPLWVSLGLYAGVLLLGPLLLSLALVGTDGVRQLLLWLDLPFSSLALRGGAVAVAGSSFALLYKLAPHAPVPWRPALIGGAAAGVFWELARYVYSELASLLFVANPVYGPLGLAPLFLTWIYLGWYIILFGARLAYAIDHADFHDEFREILQHPRRQELIATRIAQLVTRAFLDQRAGPSAKELAMQLRVPEQRLNELVALLISEGLLVSKKGELSPAKSPDDLTVADVSSAVGGMARLLKNESKARISNFEAASRVFMQADDIAVARLRAVSWADLAERSGLDVE